MIFEPGHLYHIYNQGNNRQKIFFSERNYLFFKEKMKEYILPYADILAWCLMPNHFHLMVEVKTNFNFSQGFTHSEALTKISQSEALTIVKSKTLNDSIGVMLRSYTRAINKQEKRSGSLFRKETKAICITKHNGITPAWYTSMGVTVLHTSIKEQQYHQVCLNYIHANPLKDGLVSDIQEWKYSSYHEYNNKTGDILINPERVSYHELSLI